MSRLMLLLLTLHSPLASAFEKTVMETVDLRHRSAEEIQPLIVPLMEPGEVALSSGGTLILRATPRRLEEIKALIAQLDTQLRNLVITVLQGENISAAELNAAARLRINGRTDNGSIRTRIQGGMTQIETNRTDRHSQTIRTLEGRPALIHVGQLHPIRERHIYPAPYPSIFDSTVLIEATTGFEVVPRLAGDEVILEVAPWSTSLQPHGTIRTQSAATVIRTGIGLWTEIGSSRQSSTENRSGIMARGYREQYGNLRILIKVDLAN